MSGTESFSSDAAAWVEAIGAIAAVVGSGWVAASESRATRRREDRAAAASILKDVRADLTARTAALNLATLAAAQIYDLHILLQDDAWRGRVVRVSASRALLAIERMLTSFPIQSLSNATAMLEFSRFPASLAIAAEIYTNLEAAVRAAPEADRGAIFDASNQQMERLDNLTKKHLRTLRKSLKLETHDEKGSSTTHLIKEITKSIPTTIEK